MKSAPKTVQNLKYCTVFSAIFEKSCTKFSAIAKSLPEFIDFPIGRESHCTHIYTWIFCKFVVDCMYSSPSFIKLNKKTYPERAVLTGSGVSMLMQMYNKLSN